MGRLATLVIASALLASACGSADDASPTASLDEGTTTTTVPDADLTLVNLNILHGAFCPDETARCGAEDRVSLFFSQLARACPDLVALQEIDGPMLEKIREAAPAVCDGSYEVVWHGTRGVDRELVLARVPVVDQELTMLPGGLRTAFWVRATTDLGTVDLVVTHLASIDNVDCDASQCPPPCEPPEPMRVCQARHALDFLESHRADGSIAVLASDFNDVPTGPAVAVFTGGGLVDSHVAAGNPPCDRASGSHCTSGREDGDLSDLTDPAARQTRRIDYVLVGTPSGCEPVFDSAADADADGVGTGLFFPDPAEPTGTSGVVFPSDHSAVSIDLSCRSRRQPASASAAGRDAPNNDAWVTAASVSSRAPRSVSSMPASA